MQVFGNTSTKERDALSSLIGYKPRLTQYKIAYLVELDERLIWEYNEILKQEESMWL